MVDRDIRLCLNVHARWCVCTCRKCRGGLYVPKNESMIKVPQIVQRLVFLKRRSHRVDLFKMGPPNLPSRVLLANPTQQQPNIQLGLKLSIQADYIHMSFHQLQPVGLLWFKVCWNRYEYTFV